MKKLTFLATTLTALSLVSGNALANSTNNSLLLTIDGQDKNSFNKQIEQTQKLQNSYIKNIKDSLSKEEKKLAKVADVKSQKIFEYVNNSPRDLRNKFNSTAVNVYSSLSQPNGTIKGDHLSDIIYDLYGKNKDKYLSKPFEDCRDRAKHLKDNYLFAIKLQACTNEVFTRYELVNKLNQLISGYESQLEQLKNIQYRVKKSDSVSDSSIVSSVIEYNNKTRELVQEFVRLSFKIKHVDQVFTQTEEILKKSGAGDRTFADKLFSRGKMQIFKPLYEYLKD